jgi:Kef-type K+ transport system membrane component KefB
MGNVFLEFTVVICFAALISLIFRFFKQPAILAYILTGIVIGPLGFFHLTNVEFFSVLAEVGITLLLFMIGLEIRIADLSSVGKMTLIVGPAQITFSFIIAYIIALLFGFPFLSALYIALAITFSSTIIIVKLFSDKRELHALYAKMSLGILLIQDFLAIMFLIFLSGFSLKTGTFAPVSQFGLVLLKAVILFGIIVLLSQKIFPKITEFLAKSQETLFLASIAWVFGLAALVSSPYIGFSVEIGGFLAGLALANSIANYQIIARVKILRDFFIVIFFVLLGVQMKFANIGNIIIPAIVLSFFALIIKPFITMLIMGDLGYRKRTSFLTGLSLGQISEFSLIMIFLGYKLGHISDEVVSLITFIGIITFVLSTYGITYSKKLYSKTNGFLSFLENKNDKRIEVISSTDSLEHLKNHVVIVGGDQMGQSILEVLAEMKIDVVVIDFDPGIYKKLEEKKINRLFGDIADLDIQERAKLDSAKLVISTIPDLEDNLLLLQELRHENRKAKIVVIAMEAHEAKSLYKAGADYVVLPYLAGGRQISEILDENNLNKIKTLKEKDKDYLK